MDGRRSGIAGLACALLVLTGCSPSTGGHAAVPTTATPITSRRVPPLPPVPQPDPKPVPKPRTAVVSGVARGDGGTGVGHVLVGFRKADCGACAPIMATTGATGVYRLSIPVDSYTVACVVNPGVCTIAGAEDRSMTLTIAADQTLNLSVTAAAGPTTPDPEPRPPTTTTSPPPGGGYAVWGRVATNDGDSVPHITIQLVPPGHLGITIFDETGSDGSYGLTGEGVFTLLCVTPNPDYACGPDGGDGSPFTVNTADGPQHIDFLLCRSEDYPRCLAR